MEFDYPRLGLTAVGLMPSASPRRRELLAQLAIPFTVFPANIDERVLPDEVPWAYTRRVAYAKAQHIAQQEHPLAEVERGGVELLQLQTFDVQGYVPDSSHPAEVS